MKKAILLFLFFSFSLTIKSSAQHFVTSFGAQHSWGVPHLVADVVYDHFYDYNWVHASRIYTPYGYDFQVVLQRGNIFAEVDLGYNGQIYDVRYFDYYPLHDHVCNDYCGYHAPFYNAYYSARGGYRNFVVYRPSIRINYFHPYRYRRRARYYNIFSPYRFRKNYTRIYHRSDHYHHGVRNFRRNSSPRRSYDYNRRGSGRSFDSRSSRNSRSSVNRPDARSNSRVSRGTTPRVNNSRSTTRGSRVTTPRSNGSRNVSSNSRTTTRSTRNSDAVRSSRSTNSRNARVGSGSRSQSSRSSRVSGSNRGSQSRSSRVGSSSRGSQSRTRSASVNRSSRSSSRSGSVSRSSRSRSSNRSSGSSSRSSSRSRSSSNSRSRNN